MTVAIVRESDGTPHMVRNTVRNSAGSSFTVGAVVRENDTTPHTIFTATVATPTPSDRTFLATGTKRFAVTA